MISTSQFKSGIAIIMDGDLYQIVEFQHVKPGKGGAFVRTKLRNMKFGTVIDRTFKSGDKVEDAFIERKELLYQYRSGNEFHFMDQETYEGAVIPGEMLKDVSGYLKEEMVANAMYHNGRLLGVELPSFVELTIQETEPGVKGDTAKGGTKLAKLETGASVQVPLFVEIGDIIKVDTRTGTYVERVGKA